ncbi:MAG TPA: CAAX prenyl protease-related protein, partial [Gemmatimonadaceae bacterium]|nr:CAAX prenyl protease-related protein [Gemmatimonadaceae bacterium]
SATTESSERAAAHTAAWIGPFIVFIVWLSVDKYVPIANPGKEIIRDLVILAAILGFSRTLIPTRAPNWLASVGVGVGVFVLWIAPDALVHGWRAHALFQNPITGELRTSIPSTELTPLMLGLRTARAALLVPVLEELFWRGWLPRWLQDSRFTRIPLGQYTPLAFWATAVLFAAEHGPYWDVGLVCGIIYNWWMRRTKSLGDVMLVHGVTNLALSLYVIATAKWVFWM